MLKVGNKIKVRYRDAFTYTFDVEITDIVSPVEFVARIEGIFSDGGEVTGGEILALKGRTKLFRSEDIIL